MLYTLHDIVVLNASQELDEAKGELASANLVLSVEAGTLQPQMVYTLRLDAQHAPSEADPTPCVGTASVASALFA